MERNIEETLTSEPLNEQQLEDAGSIRGWLLFFFITAIIGAIKGVITTITLYDSTSMNLSIADLATSVCSLILIIWMIAAFVRRDRNAVSIAMALLGFDIAYGILTLALSAVAIFDPYELVKIGMHSILYGIIWMLFITNSTQVAERIPSWYRRPSYIAMAIAVGVVIVNAIILFPKVTGL